MTIHILPNISRSKVRKWGMRLVLHLRRTRISYFLCSVYKTLDSWSREMLSFDFLEQGLRIVSPLNFVYDFSRKMFLTIHSYNWPNLFACFTSWDIGQYVCCNGLLKRFWRHKLWNLAYLSNQVVLLDD